MSEEIEEKGVTIPKKVTKKEEKVIEPIKEYFLLDVLDIVRVPKKERLYYKKKFGKSGKKQSLELWLKELEIKSF